MSALKMIVGFLGVMFGSCPLIAQTHKPLAVERLMTPAEFRASGLNKLSATEMQMLNAWFNRSIAKAIAVEKASKDDLFPDRVVELKHITNGIIVAADGQFLGTISLNPIDAKSISNEIGVYGSSIGRFSIFNEISQYGSEIGRYSPFNAIATKPPEIYVDGKRICYLTLNKLKSPRFDPRLLKAWVRSNQ
jgi:hypothetical protein